MSDRTSKPPCVLYTGHKRAGYGRIHDGARLIDAHRAAWGLKRGPIPRGMTLDHYRMNEFEADGTPNPRFAPCSRARFNVEHLECVSGRINAQRANRRETCRRGHVRTKANTYIVRRTDRREGSPPQRQCRDCRKIREAA